METIVAKHHCKIKRIYETRIMRAVSVAEEARKRNRRNKTNLQDEGNNDSDQIMALVFISEICVQ